jgi:hypothetical protein
MYVRHKSDLGHLSKSLTCGYLPPGMEQVSNVAGHCHGGSSPSWTRAYVHADSPRTYPNLPGVSDAASEHHIEKEYSACPGQECPSLPNIAGGSSSAGIVVGDQAFPRATDSRRASRTGRMRAARVESPRGGMPRSYPASGRSPSPEGSMNRSERAWLDSVSVPPRPPRTSGPWPGGARRAGRHGSAHSPGILSRRDASGQRTSHGSANFSRPSTCSNWSFSAVSVPGCAV